MGARGGLGLQETKRLNAFFSRTRPSRRLKARLRVNEPCRLPDIPAVGYDMGELLNGIPTMQFQGVDLGLS
jgi:hypothetical protein